MENDKFKIKHCLFGSLFSLVSIILLSVILSALSKLLPAITDKVLVITTYIIICISAFLGGIMSGKGTQSGGIIYGILTAFITIAAIKLIEVLTTGKISQLSNYMFTALSVFIPTVIGEIIGVNSK